MTWRPYCDEKFLICFLLLLSIVYVHHRQHNFFTAPHKIVIFFYSFTFNLFAPLMYNVTWNVFSPPARSSFASQITQPSFCYRFGDFYCVCVWWWEASRNEIKEEKNLFAGLRSCDKKFNEGRCEGFLFYYS